ncbi:hypothetical protein HOY80DRAFT_297114 [Tuber brumale]|nr:hypothetical protein HOY80DRAFT_297114 [Tuber brumale]
MLSIKGMLVAEPPISPKRSASGEQQPPSPRSSPESQNPRETEQRGGNSPRDKQGVGALLAAIDASQEYRGALQPLLPPPPPTMTQTTSSQEFTQKSRERIPGPPASRKRKASEAAGSPAPTPTPTPTPTVKKQKRAPRPPYTKEQEDFIWFCRDDLAMSWRKVVELYNHYWHPFESEPHIRSESGLQSRYYRILDFPVKIRKRQEPSRPDLGLIPSTNRRYPWMGVLTDRRDKENCVAGGGVVSGGIGVGVAGGGGGGSLNLKRKATSSGGRSPNVKRRALSGSGSGGAIAAASNDGRVDDDDTVDEGDGDCGGGGDLNETGKAGTASPSGSDNEHSPHYHQRHHDHHHHPYNTPTRSLPQTSHLRPSNLLTNIDQPKSDSHGSSWTTSSSSSPLDSTAQQHHQSRCTYPRPPDRLAPLGALLEHIGAPRSCGRVRISRGIQNRYREGLAGEGEAEGEAERERERRPEARRVDPRLSVTSLCV